MIDQEIYVVLRDGYPYEAKTSFEKASRLKRELEVVWPDDRIQICRTSLD